MFQIHGGRRNEGQVLVNGMSAGYQGMGVSGYTPEVGNAQEINVTLSGALAESVTGGPQVNVIQQAGRQQLQREHVLQLRGRRVPDREPQRRAEGLRPDRRSRSRSCGTSTRRSAARSRDRVWFFASFRYQGNRQRINMLTNANAGDPTKWTYAPDDKAGD